MAKKQIEFAVKELIWVDYKKLVPFQGNLKDLFKRGYDALRNEILSRKFSAPVYIWQDNGKNYILDGHQRRRVVKDLVEKEGYSCGPLPCVVIESESFQEAKFKVLGFSMVAGSINEQGMAEFQIESKIEMGDMGGFPIPGLNMEVFQQSYGADPLSPMTSNDANSKSVSNDTSSTAQDEPKPTAADVAILKIKITKPKEVYLCGPHKLTVGKSEDLFCETVLDILEDSGVEVTREKDGKTWAEIKGKALATPRRAPKRIGAAGESALPLLRKKRA